MESNLEQQTQVTCDVYSVQRTGPEPEENSESVPLLPLISRSRSTVYGWLFVSFLCVVLGAGVVCGIYLLIREDDDHLDPMPPGKLSLVIREEWGALQSNGSMPDLVLPADRVLLVQASSTSSFQEGDCSSEIRSLQRYQMQQFNEPDILYNFIIGSDAKTYEGRGWYYCSRFPDYFDKRTVTVGFLGAFHHKPLPDLQISELEYLLDYAVEIGKLIPCYILLVKREPNSTSTALLRVVENLQKKAKPCT